MRQSTRLSCDILPELAPADFFDPVIEAYKKDIDRTLLRENLKLSVEERVHKAERLHRSIALAHGAAQRAPLSRKGTEALLEERGKSEPHP